MVLAANPPQASTTTVLFIDDNDEDLKYWCEGLKNYSSHNYTVLDAPSGEAGLELCRSQRIDCVVLDLDMPESGFYVLFDLVRDRTRPQIAVVILSHLLLPQLNRRNLHFNRRGESSAAPRNQEDPTSLLDRNRCCIRSGCRTTSAVDTT